MNEWTRIPVPFDSETDRRTMAGIMTAAGLEIRIVKEKQTKSGSYKRYIEYRHQT